MLLCVQLTKYVFKKLLCVCEGYLLFSFIKMIARVVSVTL